MTRATVGIICLSAGLGLASCAGGGGGDGSRAARAGSAAVQGLYGIDPATGTLLYIDPATATATAIGPVGLPIGATGADFACDGTLWALSSAGGASMDLYTVDLGSGAGTVVKEFDVPGLSTTSGFEFGPDETAMYWRNGTGLYRLDPIAGTAQLVASAGGGGVSLTMPASCDQFLAGDCAGGECDLVRIDPETGALTGIGPTGGIAFTSMAAAPDGSLYGHSSGRLYRIDPATGATTLIGTIGSGESSFQPVGMAYGPVGVCCLLDCSTAAPTVSALWPPNHRMVEVGVTGVATSSGAPVEAAVTAVSQDEPVNAAGDGNTGPDAAISGGRALLRAERSGGGDGRVYHLSFTASSGGRSCQGVVQVCVPHDQGAGATCGDQGPLYDSTLP